MEKLLKGMSLFLPHQMTFKMIHMVRDGYCFFDHLSLINCRIWWIQFLIRANFQIINLILQIFKAYLKDKNVTKERIYIETVEEIFSNVEKIIIDGEGGAGGVVPYLPLKALNSSTGGK